MQRSERGISARVFFVAMDGVWAVFIKKYGMACLRYRIILYHSPGVYSREITLNFLVLRDKKEVLGIKEKENSVISSAWFPE